MIFPEKKAVVQQVVQAVVDDADAVAWTGGVKGEASGTGASVIRINLWWRRGTGESWAESREGAAATLA